jgi:hypothetical protein
MEGPPAVDVMRDKGEAPIRHHRQAVDRPDPAGRIEAEIGVPPSGFRIQAGQTEGTFRRDEPQPEGSHRPCPRHPARAREPELREAAALSCQGEEQIEQEMLRPGRIRPDQGQEPLIGRP